MSEHQYVAFRAIDKPVANEDTGVHAEAVVAGRDNPMVVRQRIQFGDFRGNAVEMFAVVTIFTSTTRITELGSCSSGFPTVCRTPTRSCLTSVRIRCDSRRTSRDLAGPIAPYHESGDLDELWGFGDLLNRLAPLRTEILDGDLRPLYLAHLVMACDGEHDPEETKEAPVPAGLKQLSDAQRALTEYFGLSDALIAAAAEHSPPLNAGDDTRNQHAEWLKSQSQAKKDKWLTEIMSDAGSSARSEILAEFRRSRTAPLGRPFAQIGRSPNCKLRLPRLNG